MIARVIRPWAGRVIQGKQHIYFLVFNDRISAVDLTSWDTAAKDLANADQALGCVSLCVAAQPKSAFDVNTFEGQFSTTTIYGDQTRYGGAKTLAEGANVVRADHQALVAYKKRYNEEPAFALEEELKQFDWTSHYSDDHRVWAAGEAAAKRLQKLKTLVDPEVAKALVEKYQPKESA